MQNQSQEYYTPIQPPIQLKMPVEMERIIEVDDPVYSFSEVLCHIDLKKYFVEDEDYKTGRPRYDGEKLLKVILFAFMEEGCQSVRKIEKLCKTDIRFLWLLDEEKSPSHMTCCLLSRTFSSCLQNVHNFLPKMAGNLLKFPACLRCYSFSIACRTSSRSRRLILSSIVSVLVVLKCTRTI